MIGTLVAAACFTKNPSTLTVMMSRVHESTRKADSDGFFQAIVVNERKLLLCGQKVEYESDALEMGVTVLIQS